MIKGKTIHIINTIIFFILVLSFGGFNIKIITEAFTRQATPIYYGIFGIILLLISIAGILFYVKSFKSINLNKNYFKVPFILNIISLSIPIIFLLISLLFLKRMDGLFMIAMFLMILSISELLMIISIVIFIIEYKKHKTNH